MGETRRIPLTGIVLAGGGLLIGGLIAGVWAVDRAAGDLVNRFRPVLEKSLSKPIGHPVRIGDYRGLRPWGLNIGSSTIPPVAGDRSELSIGSIGVSFDPIASLRQWQPVVMLRLEDVRVQLRRNQDGRFWVPGETGATGDLPPISLRYHLAQPARISLAPIDQTLELNSRGSVELGDRWFSGSARLRWLADGGAIDVDAKGRWDQPELALRLRATGLQMERLALLASAPPDVRLGGRLGADVNVNLKPGSVACRGSVQVQDAAVETASLPAPVRSDQIRLSCRDSRVNVATRRLTIEDWIGQASGHVELNRAFDLRLQVRHASRQDRLSLRIDGPWSEPSWRFNVAAVLPPSSPVVGPLTAEGQLTTPWQSPQKRFVRVDDLLLKGTGMRLRFGGMAFPELSLRSTELSVAPEAWRSVPMLSQVLGGQASIRGSLMAEGSLQDPALKIRLSQSENPLLDRWRLLAQWTKASGVAALQQFDSPFLQASGRLPLDLQAKSLQTGDLQASVDLRAFGLNRLMPLTGVPMGGSLSARGRFNGPLQALRSDLALALDQPRVGAVQVPERWQGHLRGVLRQGATLAMQSEGSHQVSGSLQADLAADWMPNRLALQRQQGVVSMERTPDALTYRWQADRLALDGVQLALPPKGRFQGISGDLSGTGHLALNPLRFDGSITLDDPVAMGIALEQVRVDGRLKDRRFHAEGSLQPKEGDIQFTADGELGGPLRSRAEAKELSVPWLVNLARQLRETDADLALDPGRAEDLGSLVINTFGGTLDGQLKALAQSKQALDAFQKANPDQGFDPDDLHGRLDAVIFLNGPQFSALELELDARGHLWLDDDDRDRMLHAEPFVATLRGPLQGGEGEFTLLHLPFSLLALFAPVPPGLKGAVGIAGKTRFDPSGPLIQFTLMLEDAKLGQDSLVLDRADVTLGSEGLTLDLALRSTSSTEAIAIQGSVPLRGGEAIDVLVESHGDALDVLTQLAPDIVQVKRGNTDLRLILRGTLENPQANGFVVVRNLDLGLSGQEIRRINASMLFDFNRLEVQKLEAQLASGGTLKGSGAIGLFAARDEATPLTLELNKGRIRQSSLEVLADARIVMEGALVRPVIGGEVALNKGVIRPRGSLLSRVGGRFRPAGTARSSPAMAFVSAESIRPVTMNQLIEQNWDFKQPLVLYGPGSSSQVSSDLQRLIPDLSSVRFRNLRLKLGPDLAVRMPPILNFRGGGQLLLNGPLDPNLELRGVVRLNRGRISLFSTTFRLDHQAPNVAVFTPSLGLVPYVDIAMKTQVSDSVQVGVSGTSSSNVFETNGQGMMGAGGGQLRLVKVTVKATGPANRLMGNLELRSAPPMSQSQLLSLIGGNSLAGLAGGGAGAALATVVGQTLLSPVLGTLSDVMDDRLQIALYPTYVTPSVNSEKERTSGRVPPTFTVVTELGMDVTDQFDFSVLAAPNNSDVPPQATVTYQLNPNTSLTGSVDSEGTWQSQLRVFFRF